MIKKTESTAQKRRLGEIHVSQNEENELEPDSAMISTLELALARPSKLDTFFGYRRSGITNLVSSQDGMLDASQGAAKRQVTPSAMSNNVAPA